MENRKTKSIRKFGKPIDANRRRSLSISKRSKKTLKSSNVDDYADSVKLEKPNTTVVILDRKKRAAEDDGEAGDSVGPPLKRHSPEKKVVTLKDNVPAVKSTDHGESSTSPSSLPPPSKTEDIENLVIPSASELMAMYPAEQQIKWMCTADGADQDPDYYVMLIHERMRGLLEVWQDNDRLAKEVAHLQAEEAVIDPLFEKVIAIKECLAESDD